MIAEKIDFTTFTSTNNLSRAHLTNISCSALRTPTWNAPAKLLMEQSWLSLHTLFSLHHFLWFLCFLRFLCAFLFYFLSLSPPFRRYFAFFSIITLRLYCFLTLIPATYGKILFFFSWFLLSFFSSRFSLLFIFFRFVFDYLARVPLFFNSDSRFET